MGADVLLPSIQANVVLGDKAYSAQERVIDVLEKAGKTAIIPSRENAKKPREYDREVYKERHLIENLFARIKQFRAIATRYDKTAMNFLGAVYLVAVVVWLN